MRDKGPIPSELLFHLHDNLATLKGGRVKPRDYLDHEIWMVGEITNEIIHLPYDAFMIPWIRRLGVETKARAADDVLLVETWGKGYLIPDEDCHQKKRSVQADLTVVLSDVVVLFEFKRYRGRRSESVFAANQLGRQALLATKLGREYGVDWWVCVLVCQSATVNVRGRGRIQPAEAALHYLKGGDKWFRLPEVADLRDRALQYDLASRFIVLDWATFFDRVDETIVRALESAAGRGEARVFENARETIVRARDRRHSTPSD